MAKAYRPHSASVFRPASNAISSARSPPSSKIRCSLIGLGGGSNGAKSLTVSHQFILCIFNTIAGSHLGTLNVSSSAAFSACHVSGKSSLTLTTTISGMSSSHSKYLAWNSSMRCATLHRSSSLLPGNQSIVIGFSLTCTSSTQN